MYYEADRTRLILAVICYSLEIFCDIFIVRRRISFFKVKLFVMVEFIQFFFMSTCLEKPFSLFVIITSLYMQGTCNILIQIISRSCFQIVFFYILTYIYQILLLVFTKIYYTTIFFFVFYLILILVIL